MAFGLAIGTERAAAFQQSIENELIKRELSQEADPVLAEYITIMVINNKTAAQITAELEDLIGSDFDPSFTDWLFAEAARGSPESQVSPQPSTSERPAEQAPTRDAPPPTASEPPRRQPQAPRSGIYQQAISQALPSAFQSGQKRSASARSPSPTHPSKTRRTDLPTGPRAMLRDGSSNSGAATASRSLLDRVGGPATPSRNGTVSHRNDDIQARIDSIVNNNSPDPNMMMNGGFPGMGVGVPGAMDMSMANPLMLQEIMMNQMALMTQMAASMGMMNPQFGAPGFPMQGMMPGDMSMFAGGNMNGLQGQQTAATEMGVGGRPSVRDGRSRGRGGAPSSVPKTGDTTINSETDTATVATPKPVDTVSTPAIATPLPSQSQPQRIAYALPERPQTPSLCKFGLKCTNAHCRYSHPSPVATVESGVVLSNEACEKGKDCQDKDCIKAHVSPAVLNPNAAEQSPPSAVSQPAPAPTYSHPHGTSHIPCRFGNTCTRPNCAFSHPTRPPPSNHFAQQCRFGAGCTRATCPFQHPEGRVLPTSFHRGLSTSAPLVNVPTPEPGSMGGPSPHRSVTFNNPSVKEKLEKQVKEIEEKKSQAEKAVKEAEAAASKKEESKSVTIAA